MSYSDPGGAFTLEMSEEEPTIKAVPRTVLDPAKGPTTLPNAAAPAPTDEKIPDVTAPVIAPPNPPRRLPKKRPVPSFFLLFLSQ